MARLAPVHSGYTIINGSGTGTNGGRIDVWVEYSLGSASVTGNYTPVTAYFYAALNPSYTSSTSNVTGLNSSFSVGAAAGEGVADGAYDFTSSSVVNLLGSFSGNIPHNSDGTKKISVTGSFTTLSSYISGGSVSGSVTLPTIDRESTVKASNANIGAASTVTVTRKNSSFTHAIAYRFGSLSGYLNGAGNPVSAETKLSAKSLSFTLPESFYAQIPNDKTGTCTLSCKTYSGSKQIGTAQTCTFTVGTDKTLCAPGVSGTVEDSNAATLALTGDKNVFIRGKSNALCTISATAKNSASVKTKTIGGTAVSGSSRTVTGIEADAVVFSATDSRGYTTQYKKTLSVVPYVQLTCNASVKRTTPTGSDATLTVKGQCYKGSFGAVTNALTLTCKVNGKTVTVSPEIAQNNTYAVSVQLSDLPYTQSYQVKVTAADELSAVTKTLTLKTGQPVFDWGQNDFQFHVPVYFPGNTMTLGDKDMDNLVPGAYCITTDHPVDTGVGVIQVGALLDIPYLGDLRCRLQVIFPRDSTNLYIRHKWLGTWHSFTKLEGGSNETN